MQAIRHVVIMGVSGCGKSTLAQAFALASGHVYLDADDFHPPQNVEKMRAGQALTDADRAPWLRALNQRLLQAPLPCVLACSALKRAYREIIADNLHLRYVYLQGSEAQIAARLHARQDHYMPASLLASQLATLEEPGSEEALFISVSDSTEQAVKILKEDLCV
ncbi:MAG: hypothetical protein RLZZ502_55 [Pseudomonadota bacterium]|jgi:gluconokinase